jgi:hypothetical protein
LALVAGLSMTPSVVRAQAGTPRPATPSAPQSPSTPASPQQPAPTIGELRERPDARETRQRLQEIFNQHPPSVREVLRIDPTLLSRGEYLATYPLLAAFIAQHPEIAHNPAFFIGEWQYRERTPGSEPYRALTDTVEYFTVIMSIGIVTSGIFLLARMVVEHRRWQRAMRAQSELQTKLIDRFSSSDDLLAYLQTPAGKALTEPLSMPHAAPRPMSAPLSRIFWSLQSGIVVSALGTGLIVVGSAIARDEFADVLHGIGIIVLLIGIGFTLSSAVSYFLSHRLGLVQSLTARYGGETPPS